MLDLIIAFALGMWLGTGTVLCFILNMIACEEEEDSCCNASIEPNALENNAKQAFTLILWCLAWPVTFIAIPILENKG
jgi:hypothetical protein